MSKIEAAMKEAASRKENPSDTGAQTEEGEDVFPSPLGIKPGKLILAAERTDSDRKARKLRKQASRLQGQQDMYMALDKRRCLAEDAEDPTELPAPDSAAFGREPQEKYGALKVSLKRLGGSVVEESSGKRYGLFSQWQRATGEKPRAQRYEVVLPQHGSPIDEETRPTSETDVKLMRTVPQPQTPKEKRSAQGDLAGWQRGQAIGRLRNRLEETDRLAVHAEDEQPHAIARSFTVTALDRGFVKSFAKDLSELHYLKGFTSGGGYLPESDEPDYRRYDYMAVDAVEASQVAQALGAGPYVREVDDPEDADLEKDGRLYEVIVDGRCPLLCPEELPEHEMREFQIRAAIGHDNRPRGLAKGMARPYDESALRDALAWAEAHGAETAATILQTVLDSGTPTLLLVKDDQLKVGPDRVRPWGEALVTATHLRGSRETETVEVQTGSYERAKPQYGRIRANPQCTQLLTPRGFELLEEHVRIEARLIAEKLKSVPGIAELVSQAVRRQLEDAKGGTYNQGRDHLTDAIIGGGVRLKHKGVIEAMTGGTGEIMMLPSTLGRLDFNVAAHIRSHLFTGMGIYGYGHHHAACANSEALCRSLWQNDPPHADPSAVAFPYKVSRLLNADDDGDIVVSLAANTEVGDKRAKVILTWRYPCVDVPVLWAFEEGTRTPFDGTDEEERERFSRIIKAFGPEIEEGQPDLEDDEVTRLSAGHAVRLSNKGAKEQVDKTRASGPVNLSTSMRLVNKKRQLGQAGPLTRDLERCGELMALAMRKGESAAESGHEHLYRKAEAIYHDALDLATTTSVRIEDNLTAFKYETMPTLKSVDFTIEKLGYEQIDGGQVYLGDDDAVTGRLTLDYHDVVDTVTSVLPRFADDRDGVSLLGGTDPDGADDTEPWDGPAGISRHARLIRRLCQEEIPKIGENLAAISTEKAPFRKILSDRVREYHEENPEERERLIAERDYVLQLCASYREFWNTVNRKETEARSRVTRPDEEFEQRVAKWRAKASRGIHEAMQAKSKQISAEGLAYGIASDWKPQRDWSPAAGMALLTGRIGELLLPPETDVDPIRSDEQFRTVYRSGADMPGLHQCGTADVTGLTRLDTAENKPDAEISLESGFTFYVHVEGESEGHPLPPGTASGEYDLKLTRTTKRGGLLRWTRG